MLFMEGSQGELPGGGDMEMGREGGREGPMRTHGERAWESTEAGGCSACLSHVAGQRRHTGGEVRTTGRESQVQQDRVVLELGCALGPWISGVTC